MYRVYHIMVVYWQVESLVNIGVTAMRASDPSMLNDAVRGRYRFGK